MLFRVSKIDNAQRPFSRLLCIFIFLCSVATVDNVQYAFQKQSLSILKLKYGGKPWDTLARCRQEEKFRLEQQLTIHTSHKPQSASQTPTELQNEKKRWQVCWKIFFTFSHVHYLLFCMENERWSKSDHQLNA